MRMRSVLAAFGAASLLVGLTTSPATAGTGPSMWCDDNNGVREIPILNSPVTVGVEVNDGPVNGPQTLAICWSTTSYGQPGGVTGGAITVDVYSATGTTFPGVYVALACAADPGVAFGPACIVVNSANVAWGDVAPSTPSSAVCLVSAGAGCLAYLPGVKVATGGDAGRALLTLQILNMPLAVDAPAQCVAVIVTCP